MKWFIVITPFIVVLFNYAQHGPGWDIWELHNGIVMSILLGVLIAVLFVFVLYISSILTVRHVRGTMTRRVALPVSTRYMRDALLARVGHKAKVREWGEGKTTAAIEMMEIGVDVKFYPHRPENSDADSGKLENIMVEVRSDPKKDPGGAGAAGVRQTVDGIAREVQARMWVGVRVLDDSITVDDEGPARCLRVEIPDWGLKFLVFADLIDDFNERPGRYAKGRKIEVFLDGRFASPSGIGRKLSGGAEVPGSVPALKCKVVDASPTETPKGMGQRLIREFRGKYIITHVDGRASKVGDAVSVGELGFWLVREDGKSIYG